MKIKFNKDSIKELAPYMAFGTMVLGIAGISGYYYLPDNFKDNIKQMGEADINIDDLEISDSGEMYYLFNEGEHRVQMSQNDAWHRKIESVEGYEIVGVEVNGWRDNSQVTFINKVPVRVRVTGSIDGSLKFDDFGEVLDREKVKSK